MAIGYSLRMCARHVDSTNPGRSNLVFRSKPIPEAEISNRLINVHLKRDFCNVYFHKSFFLNDFSLWSKLNQSRMAERSCVYFFLRLFHLSLSAAVQNISTQPRFSNPLMDCIGLHVSTEILYQITLDSIQPTIIHFLTRSASSILLSKSLTPLISLQCYNASQGLQL